MNTEKETENVDRMDLNPKEFEKLLCEFCKQDLDTKIKGKLVVSEILICGEAKNWNSVW